MFDLLFSFSSRGTKTGGHGSLPTIFGGGPHEDPPELAQILPRYGTYRGLCMEHGTWNINPAKLWHYLFYGIQNIDTEAFPFAYQSDRVTVIVNRYGWVDRRMSDVRTHMQDGVIVYDILSCIHTE